MASPATAAARETSTPLTVRLVEHGRAIEWSGLPADVREIARQCVLDWMGVALAGSSDPLTRLLIDQALADGGKPLSSLVGHAPHVAPLQAALINGTASHVLDYDDVNLSMNGHPSAAILPGLLALGESERASGAEVIAAFIAGYEMACRVGLLMAPGHYARGHHSTATIGTLGSASACAHLMKLDTERTAHAIGIAATQAAGLKSMFGTECKPFHAGTAAHNGLRAARLAAAGMTCRTDALECAQGFAATLSPDFHPEAALRAPEKFYIRDNLFKYHASCYGTHAVIECARELRESHGFLPDAIAKVTVLVDRGAEAMCNIASPKSALEAKFSLRFMTGAALAGADTSDLAFFNDARTGDETLCSLRDKVTVEFFSDRPKMQSEVAVRLKDGRTVRAKHDAGIPHTDIARQGERLSAKFERLAEPVLGAERCARLSKLLATIDCAPVDELMAAAALER